MVCAMQNGKIGGTCKLAMIFLSFILLLSNCLVAPTNERTACVYDLKERRTPIEGSNDSCQIIPFLLSEDGSQSAQGKRNAAFLANYELLKCLEYHQRMKDCKKEINYYIPTLHN